MVKVELKSFEDFDSLESGTVFKTPLGAVFLKVGKGYKLLKGGKEDLVACSAVTRINVGVDKTYGTPVTHLQDGDWFEYKGVLGFKENGKATMINGNYLSLNAIVTPVSCITFTEQ